MMPHLWSVVEVRRGLGGGEGGGGAPPPFRNEGAVYAPEEEDAPPGGHRQSIGRQQSLQAFSHKIILAV